MPLTFHSKSATYTSCNSPEAMGILNYPPSRAHGLLELQILFKNRVDSRLLGNDGPECQHILKNTGAIRNLA